MNRSLKWVLVVSLVLNVVLAAFLSGHGMRPFSHHGKVRMEMSGLAPEKRERLHSALESMKDARREHMQKVRELRDEIVAIMEAPEFDGAAFRAKSLELSGLYAVHKREMIEEMASLAENSSLEERKVLANYLKRPPKAKSVR